ncbi:MULTISPECIES: Fe-S cluster assembly sulfur transfer protein SufU [Clostridium]|uniref:Fe-S cluster assembly sulfur transfer protein SufU n=1 Tax=Clostridium TaxID=1485 RepID=UPI00069F67DA|nr:MULTISPECIES: SUF system NifU family Fe-S cluster assembly protein [Clostridium]KOF58007.1 nitrogen fixation protein NifU [Clostridium sp. DMHC 10]MCD2348673.1 SUF system NifU family Fe-S cluster assembly protein [Clostridium guangxiense]
MDLNSIYTEIITEHNASKHNKHELEGANIVENGHNPSCGDEITLQLKIKDNIIEDASFTGIGCAISQASTSIMIDLIKGKTVEEAKELAHTFIGMIKREITDDKELEVLEDALAFKNVSNMPARVKCAVLAWHTLDEATTSSNSDN